MFLKTRKRSSKQFVLSWSSNKPNVELRERLADRELAEERPAVIGQRPEAVGVDVPGLLDVLPAAYVGTLICF